MTSKKEAMQFISEIMANPEYGVIAFSNSDTEIIFHIHPGKKTKTIPPSLGEIPVRIVEKRRHVKERRDAIDAAYSGHKPQNKLEGFDDAGNDAIDRAYAKIS